MYLVHFIDLESVPSLSYFCHWIY